MSKLKFFDLWFSGVRQEDLEKMNNVMQIEELNIGESGIEDFSKLKSSLKSISMMYARIKNIDFPNLEIMKNCDSLFQDLEITFVDCPKMKHLDYPNGVTNIDYLTNFTEMEELSFLHVDKEFKQLITDDHLRNMKKLRVLRINGMKNITNDVIKTFVDLEEIDCTGTLITDEGVKNLHKLKVLRCSEHMTDDATKNLTNLELLHMSSIMTDGSLENLRNMKTLHCSHHVTDKYVQQMTELTNLYAKKSHITDISLENLHKLENLQCSCFMSDNGIKNLRKLFRIDNKDTNTKFTNFGIENLLRLEILIDNNSKFSGHGLRNLYLKELYLNHNLITFNDIKHMKMLELPSYSFFKYTTYDKKCENYKMLVKKEAIWM